MGQKTRMAITFVPQSIRGRLLLAAFVFTGLALLVAGLSIGNVFDRAARRGLNDRLDGQIALIGQAVRADGTLDRDQLAQIGPITRHRGGWGWSIEATNGVARSADFVPLALSPRADHRHGGRIDHDRPGGKPYVRFLEEKRATGTVRISAWAPRFVIERARRAAIWPWIIALGTLAAFLAVATFLQLRVGLRPLQQVKVALRSVRAGSSERIPEDQPLELRELVSELNGLLDENQAALSRARSHVANLAHSLKTPLATLELKLRDSGRDPDGDLAGLVAQVEGAIRHHLGRARAASPGAPGALKVELRPALAALLAVFERIHIERGIVADNGVPPDMTVKCDPQDLDEMLGNLLDNGWKWAKSRISVQATQEGADIRIVIDDDGPGLSPDEMAIALVRGQRLDERDGGHGFGLPIARELAELHGGSLELTTSPLGGLRAILMLPR
jgi:signal transduction histidine kinase